MRRGRLDSRGSHWIHQLTKHLIMEILDLLADLSKSIVEALLLIRILHQGELLFDALLLLWELHKILCERKCRVSKIAQSTEDVRDLNVN